LTTPSSRTEVSGFDQLYTGKAGEGGRVRTGIAVSLKKKDVVPSWHLRLHR